MIHTYTYNNETWVDIDHGTPEEIHTIMNKYAIHPFVAKELTSATPKARVEFHDSYIYCILHFPVFKHTHSEGKSQEMDFIIGKGILITARYDTIDALDMFGKTLEMKEVLEKDHKEPASLSIFATMLKDLYGSLFEELEYIEDVRDDITKQIFQGNERKMVVAVSEVTRTLLDFKKITDFHHEILESLHHHGRTLLGDTFSREIETVLLDYLKINTIIRSNLDMLRELRDTNNSLLTTKQNETIKQLTVMGSVILPLNLIAVLFSMRVGSVPFTQNPNGFWIVVCIMLASVVATLGYARHKKWLK